MEREEKVTGELKCSCGGAAKIVSNIEYKGLTFSGWRCRKCKEEMVDPYQANLYLKYAKLKREGKLKVKVRKIGNSLAISIPSVLRELLALKEGEEMKLELTKEGVFARYDRKSRGLVGLTVVNFSKKFGIVPKEISIPEYA